MPRTTANGIEIAYEVQGEGAPLLMIMGLGCQLVHWPDELCDRLAARGFQAIRFDNRDVGESTWLDDAPAPHPLRSVAHVALRWPLDPPYTLEDMADDSAGLLDALKLDSAHVVGVSMGGMIAQTLALRHPTRVRSLTSIMSSPGGFRSLIGRPRAMYWLLRPYPDDPHLAFEQAVDLFRVIGGDGFPFDEELIRHILRRTVERGDNEPGFLRQLAAICAGGDRTKALAGVQAPTVVIHGTKDPLARPINGRRTARAIPGARLAMVEGMGHNLHRGVWDRIVEEIASVAGLP